MTLDDAMKPDAPVGLSEDGKDRPPNIADHIQIERGDIAAGFKAADYIIEREFKSSLVHQGYIEPHNALAIYNSDGYVTIYCSTQGQFIVRTLTAALLGMPEGKIRVIPAEIGGGFGGKTTVYLEPVAALLSQKTGRPVKMVMTRAEVLRASGPTSGTKIRAKLGATRDGKITAAEIWMAYEAGAYPGSPCGGAAMTTLGPYNIANLKIDAFDVVVNKPKVAAYRAPGAPTSAYACESVIDELAEKCGIDPIPFLILNASPQRPPQPPATPPTQTGHTATSQHLKASSH